MITSDNLKEIEKIIDEVLSKETSALLRKYIQDYDPIPTQIYSLSIQRDGGTVNINTDAGVFCVDHRYDTDKIGSIYRIEDRSYKYPRNHILYVKILVLLDEISNRLAEDHKGYLDVCYASDAFDYIMSYLNKNNEDTLISLRTFLINMLEDINRDSVKYVKKDKLDSIQNWIKAIDNLPESVYRSKENTKINKNIINKLLNLNTYEIKALKVGSSPELEIQPDPFGGFILLKDVQKIINELTEENER